MKARAPSPWVVCDRIFAMAAAPKKERRLSDAIFQAGERMIPAFKAMTGMRSILGNRDIMRAFDLRRVHGSSRARLTELANDVKDAPARPPRGVSPAMVDIDALAIELVTFAVTRGALRAEPTPEVTDLAERIDALHTRIMDLEDERDLNQLLRDTCAMVLHDLEAGSEVINECLLAVRRHEALVRGKAELARDGGKRRVASVVRDGWRPRLEAKRAERAELARRTEDVRWETLGEKEKLRVFFMEHPGKVLLMASILKNITLLCGGLVKSTMAEVTPFEVGVAAREHTAALRLLDGSDPLRTASEDDRRDAFGVLEASEEALKAFNTVNRNLVEVARLRREIARAREELVGLERMAAKAAKKAARACAEERDAVHDECSKARQDAKAHRDEVRRFYLALRRKYGLRHGFGGFPESHAAMLSELVCGDEVVERPARGASRQA